MTIEEAIQTAIQYENEIRDLYRGAVERVSDPTGKRVCTVLAREEQDHVDYLEARLAEWQTSGKVEAAALKTEIPSPDKIALSAHEVSEGMAGVDRGTELEMLGKALEAERKTSGFYRKMVSELPAEGRELFGNFVEIEDGHLAIVQAEIDALTGTGAWFDVLEIKL